MNLELFISIKIEVSIAVIVYEFFFHFDFLNTSLEGRISCILLLILLITSAFFLFWKTDYLDLVK